MEHHGSWDPAETSGHLVSVDMRNEPFSSSLFSKESYFNRGIFPLNSTIGTY
jgi:hypothetical protein